jgi:hypothetical protein
MTIRKLLIFFGFIHKDETQNEARERLTKSFKRKHRKFKDVDDIYSYKLRQAMMHICGYLESVMTDKQSRDLYMELFLLFHSVKKYEEQHTFEWIEKYYANKFTREQIKEIHKLVKRFAEGRMYYHKRAEPVLVYSY